MSRPDDWQAASWSRDDVAAENDSFAQIQDDGSETHFSRRRFESSSCPKCSEMLLENEAHLKLF